jgi:hypothetical protein
MGRFTALGEPPLAYNCTMVKAPLVCWEFFLGVACRRGRVNQRRHRYLENGQLESIGGGGVVGRGGTSSEGGGQAVEERGKLQERTRGVSHCGLAIYI